MRNRLNRVGALATESTQLVVPWAVGPLALIFAERCRTPGQEQLPAGAQSPISEAAGVIVYLPEC